MERIADLRTPLSQSLSRRVVDLIAASVEEYPTDIPRLVQLIDGPDSRVAWRAAWACERLVDRSGSPLLPYRDTFEQMLWGGRHDGTRRLLLSILYRLPRPSVFPVRLYNYCIEHMLLPQEKAAAQVLCMKMAFSLGKEEPDLLTELKFYLENTTTSFYSPAFLTARKNTLRRIYSQQKK